MKTNICVYEKKIENKQGKTFKVLKCSYNTSDTSRVIFDFRVSNKIKTQYEKAVVVEGGYPVVISLDEKNYFIKDDKRPNGYVSKLCMLYNMDGVKVTHVDFEKRENVTFESFNNVSE